MFLSAVCLLGLLSAACPFRKSDDVAPIGPAVNADLLVYFNSGVSHDEIDAFTKNVLSKPDPEGRGYDLAPGVRTRLWLRDVEGHKGVAITFFPNATKEQRQEPERAIKASPLVYRVLENTAPDSVKTLK